MMLTRQTRSVPPLQGTLQALDGALRIRDPAVCTAGLFALPVPIPEVALLAEIGVSNTVAAERRNRAARSAAWLARAVCANIVRTQVTLLLPFGERAIAAAGAQPALTGATTIDSRIEREAQVALFSGLRDAVAAGCQASVAVTIRPHALARLPCKRAQPAGLDGLAIR